MGNRQRGAELPRKMSRGGMRGRSLGSLALAALLGTSAAWSMDGIVLMSDGRPAADATVTILGRTGSTRTGPDGRFKWVPDPAPPFEVLVILPGGVYALPVLVESLPPSGSVEVRIKATVSESITVDAGATPHTEAPPASAATILVSADLEQRRPDNIVVALESIPGVGRLEEGHAAVPSIRGMARGRTLILIDGARVTTERRAGPSATYLDPFFLEAIEVSRGLGGVAYGSDAFGGVIHARTRQAAPGSPLAVRAQAAFGLSMPERSLAAQVSKGLAEGGVILQGRYRSFDDYESPEGRVPNSSFRDGGGRLRFDHEWGPGRIGLSWETDLGRDVGKPATDSGTVRAYYPREDSHRLNVSYEGDPRGGLSRWAAHAFWGWYRLATDRDRRPTPTQTRQIGRSDVQARDYGLRLFGTGAVRGWRLEGGVDLNGRTGLEALGTTIGFDAGGAVAETTEEISIEEGARHDAGVYASADGRVLRRLSASGGVRLDRVASRNRGGFFGDRDTSHGAFSGFLAATAGPFAGVTVTGQVGRGFRDPTLSDRYFRGVGGRGFVTGSPDLEPESSLQYDLALRRAGLVRTALYLYRYRITNLIERYRSGNDFFFRNRGSALVRGAELEAQADLGRGVTLEVGAQAASGRALDDDVPLADIPAEGLTITLRKAFASRGGAFLRVLLRARDDAAGATERPTPGYGTLDVSGSWRFGKLETRLTLANLLDKGYPQTPDETAVLAPGRSAVLTLTTRF